MEVPFQTVLKTDQLRSALYAGRLLLVYGEGSPTDAHACLESLASSFLGQSVYYDELSKNFRGKPYFWGTPFHFNISHTSNSFLLCFSLNQEIGVDLERNLSDVKIGELSEYAFSPDERNLLADLFDWKSFLRIWTLKEAYLKATGIGLIDALPSLHVVTAPDFGLLDSNYSGLHFICPGGETGSVVCKGALPDISFFHKTKSA